MYLQTRQSKQFLETFSRKECQIQISHKRKQKNYSWSSDGVTVGSSSANIFMTELEIVIILLLGNYLQNWKRFVDDTFTFVLSDKIGYIVNQLNSSNKKIQFTFEMEEENKLAFLNTTVYQKPTNVDIYINWHSHSPLQWKETAAKVLIQRSIRI